MTLIVPEKVEMLLDIADIADIYNIFLWFLNPSLFLDYEEVEIIIRILIK